MRTFDAALLDATRSQPSATQMVAITAMRLWALLPEALAEAERRRDDAMVSRLLFLAGCLNDADDT